MDTGSEFMDEEVTKEFPQVQDDEMTKDLDIKKEAKKKPKQEKVAKKKEPVKTKETTVKQTQTSESKGFFKNLFSKKK